MKQESTIKLIEKFDQELLCLLTEDLKQIRKNKAEFTRQIFSQLPIAS